MALTDTKLRSLKPRDKTYKVTDGGGLYVAVTPAGKITWKIAYRFAGKQKELTGGPYPGVGLAAARAWRDKAKAQLAEGLDPAAEKKRAKRQAKIAAENSFESIARDWHAKRSSVWTPIYAKRVFFRLEEDLFGTLGPMPISKIEPHDVLDVIRKIEGRGSVNMAWRVHSYVGEIFRYAVALGVAARDPSRDITAALKPRPAVKHFGSLKAAELPLFFANLERANTLPLVKDALRFTFYTLVRTQETVFATWDEFENLEGEAPLWRIPPGRMKMRAPHLVPLAKPVVALLKDLRAENPKSRFVFPGSKHEAINTATMRMAMNRMGYQGKATPHGFRATGSTILNESGLFERDWIELALAHSERDSVRAAYNSALYLSQRREMLEWWAQYLDNRRAEGMLL
jgi:integrase